MYANSVSFFCVFISHLCSSNFTFQSIYNNIHGCICIICILQLYVELIYNVWEILCDGGVVHINSIYVLFSRLSKTFNVSNFHSHLFPSVFAWRKCNFRIETWILYSIKPNSICSSNFSEPVPFISLKCFLCSQPIRWSLYFWFPQNVRNDNTKWSFSTTINTISHINGCCNSKNISIKSFHSYYS